MIDSLTMKKECPIHLEQQKRFPEIGVSCSIKAGKVGDGILLLTTPTRLLCYASLE